MNSGIIAKNLYLNEGLKIKFNNLDYRQGQFFFYHQGDIIAVISEDKLSHNDKVKLAELSLKEVKQ